MMVRSRSRDPPITGTAIAVIVTHNTDAKRVSRRAAPRVSVTGGLVGFGRRGDEGLDLEEAFLADAFHVHQLFDLLEAAALSSVLEDALGGLLPDSWQRHQLIDRRGIEIDDGLL